MVPLTDTAIDISDLKYFKFLSNLQGNILKGHGRDHTTNIFIQFAAGKQMDVRAWLKDIGENHVTDAMTQLKETELFKRNKVSGGTFCSVYLTASGYKYLENTQKLPPAFEPAFVNGMKNAALNDPPPVTWERGLAEDIHVMILVADIDPDTVSKRTKEIIDQLTGQHLGSILTIEYGSAIRNKNGDGLEHFGYVDGISQPLFLKEDVEKYNNDLVPAHTPAFPEKEPLGLVLLADPFFNDPEHNTFGSYFVFRKLEEKVRAFKLAEQHLANTLSLDGEDRERAGAMIIGRFEDGTPVTVSSEAAIYKSGMANNFDYSDDALGAKCPFHAHIRKSNPRKQGNNAHTMARRGITYGLRETNTDIDPDIEQMPTGGVGLLFMSFQSSIANQFEFIQKTWVNDPNFPSAGAGTDPVIGETNPPTASTGKFVKTWGDPTSLTTESFNHYVTLKGGEYFFAPSLKYLKAL